MPHDSIGVCGHIFSVYADTYIAHIGVCGRIYSVHAASEESCIRDAARTSTLPHCRHAEQQQQLPQQQQQPTAVAQQHQQPNAVAANCCCSNNNCRNSNCRNSNSSGSALPRRALLYRVCIARVSALWGSTALLRGNTRALHCIANTRACRTRLEIFMQ